MSDAVEDEIEASRAPLMDHLVELRARLIRSVIALFVAFVVCFAFSQQAITLLIHPFYVAAGLLAVRVQEANGVPAQDFLHQAQSMLTSTKNMFMVLAGMKDVPRTVPGQGSGVVRPAGPGGSGRYPAGTPADQAGCRTEGLAVRPLSAGPPATSWVTRG